MHVPAGVWVVTVVLFVILLGVTLWVTRKAYSRKWEAADEENRGNR